MVPRRFSRVRSVDMSNILPGWLIAGAALGFCWSAAAQGVPPNSTPDATLRSTPDTVVWGYFAADIAPALRIKSGQTVRIDTVSHGGVKHARRSGDLFRPCRHSGWRSAQGRNRHLPEGEPPQGRERAHPHRADL